MNDKIAFDKKALGLGRNLSAYFEEREEEWPDCPTAMDRVSDWSIDQWTAIANDPPQSLDPDIPDEPVPGAGTGRPLFIRRPDPGRLKQQSQNWARKAREWEAEKEEKDKDKAKKEKEKKEQLERLDTKKRKLLEAKMRAEENAAPTKTGRK